MLERNVVIHGTGDNIGSQEGGGCEQVPHPATHPYPYLPLSRSQGLLGGGGEEGGGKTHQLSLPHSDLTRFTLHTHAHNMGHRGAS